MENVRRGSDSMTWSYGAVEAVGDHTNATLFPPDTVEVPRSGLKYPRRVVIRVVVFCFKSRRMVSARRHESPQSF